MIKKNIKCPVCNKQCIGKAGVNSHMFKRKDSQHLNFIDQQHKLIDKAFEAHISCERLVAQAGCWVSATYICERWRTHPHHSLRKSEMCAAHMRKEWASGRTISPRFTNRDQPYDSDKNNTIDKEAYKTIVSMFHSDHGIVQVAKQTNCNPKTVRQVFVREFGKEETKRRGKRVASKTCQSAAAGKNKLENTNPALVRQIKKAFRGNEGLKTISKRLGTSSCAVKRIWLNTFGHDAYDERCRRMRRVSQKRSTQSLKKARFLGSKNERMCYCLLSRKLGRRNVVHHDYGIVPGLEVDISIPSRKAAICWDGPGHRRPVFGDDALRRTWKNDAIRQTKLKERGWCHIVVLDDGRHDVSFVENMVDRIITISSAAEPGCHQIGHCHA